ncbi:MAG: response regulator [Acidobacteria bacterium]|jgi:two-component system chemotaxis response regulator CheY|nr:response regulator [Acidobacteriota bacterium]
MPAKVLIVDDAMFMRAMIRDILVNSGRYEVAGEAANGEEAVAQYRALKPDVVTMDIVMPQMDGIEACKEILKFDGKAKIVMCSALGQEALVIESIAAGARDFVVKPFSAEKVLKVIDTVAAG